MLSLAMTGGDDGRLLCEKERRGGEAKRLALELDVGVRAALEGKGERALVGVREGVWTALLPDVASLRRNSTKSCENDYREEMHVDQSHKMRMKDFGRTHLASSSLLFLPSDDGTARSPLHRRLTSFTTATCTDSLQSSHLTFPIAPAQDAAE